MTQITSPNNQRLKELRKLSRSRERTRSGLFAAEGEDLVRAARLAKRSPVEGFRAPGLDVGEPSFHEVDLELLASVSTLGSGTRAIGVYRQRWDVPTGPLCVYLHGVSDPGNVGTITRSALAFGASCVALGPDCADPHSPKAVRASMGAIFAVRLARVRDVGELPRQRVALAAHEGRPLKEVCDVLRVEVRARARGSVNTASSLESRARARAEQCEDTYRADAPTVTLLVGSERDGLPDEVMAACEHVAHIPIATESLNAAMAATVALYELTREATNPDRERESRMPVP